MIRSIDKTSGRSLRTCNSSVSSVLRPLVVGHSLRLFRCSLLLLSPQPIPSRGSKRLSTGECLTLRRAAPRSAHAPTTFVVSNTTVTCFALCTSSHPKLWPSKLVPELFLTGKGPSSKLSLAICDCMGIRGDNYQQVLATAVATASPATDLTVLFALHTTADQLTRFKFNF